VVIREKCWLQLFYGFLKVGDLNGDAQYVTIKKILFSLLTNTMVLAIPIDPILVQ
jgi:hypothetical protein